MMLTSAAVLLAVLATAGARDAGPVRIPINTGTERYHPDGGVREAWARGMGASTARRWLKRQAAAPGNLTAVAEP